MIVIGAVPPVVHEILPNNFWLAVELPCRAYNLIVDVSPLFFKSAVNLYVVSDITSIVV